MPPSLVAAPATLCPPPRTETRRLVFAGEVDRRDDVGGASAAGDDCRVAVDQPVADAPGLLVAGRSRHNEFAPEVGTQGFDCLVDEDSGHRRAPF